MSYLTDYEENDRGYVAFGSNPKGGKIIGKEADMNNMDTTIQVSHVPTTRVHKDHPLDQNKKDERGILIRNKARLVAQGHTQEEEIYYDEVFAPVARIEAIRLFLACVSFKDFLCTRWMSKVLFSMERLKKRGKIDKTLFIRRYKDDIFLVQVYVDDIIFGSTKKELCIAIEKMMHKKFQMSSMGELTFFLGLQVKQKQDGLFLIIKESLVKTKQKGAILELKQRHLKKIIFCYYTLYPAMKIQRIRASSAQETHNDQFLIRRITLQPYAVCTAGRQSKIQS
uniref:Reverse transcriptase Ty1/copia-type domain-containing protein n=1 Tax=Tanacetum cinerariifolium TaxID=118510 RepID=A0A6L2N0I6_TANCI|nr:hypothetical protein [Tanacetum cinerariifolium]